jgi:6-phosphogluconolactonase
MQVFRVGPDLTDAATGLLARSLADRLLEKQRVSLALSGGQTPWPILKSLAGEDLDWNRVDIYQVDERVAPAGDAVRNLTGLASSLLDHVPATVYPMPVEESDLEAAAARYTAHLPRILDVVHLGLGDDGHTASLVPGDPVLDLIDRSVAITEPYRGHRRMTLTFRALEHAASIVWIVVGAGKAPMVKRLLQADTGIPAGRVPQDHALLVTNAFHTGESS